jgi:hypothetical protein
MQNTSYCREFNMEDKNQKTLREQFVITNQKQF